MSDFADIPGMDEEWKTRLAAAMTAKNVTKRALSLKAGRGAGYVHSILAEGKDPTVSNLVRVCDALGVSLSAILLGTPTTPEDEELLRLYQSASQAERESLLQLLRSRRS